MNVQLLFFGKLNAFFNVKLNEIHERACAILSVNQTGNICLAPALQSREATNIATASCWLHGRSIKLSVEFARFLRTFCRDAVSRLFDFMPEEALGLS
jgi:hypothetical protein